jgi:hypothetical protein
LENEFWTKEGRPSESTWTEEDVKFKWMKYGLASVGISYDFEVKNRMLGANGLWDLVG